MAGAPPLVAVDGTHQKFVSCVDNTLNDRIVEERIAHPFGNDDIDFLDALRQFDLLDLALDHFDHCERNIQR